MVLLEKNLINHFSNIWLNTKLLFGRTPVVWCTPWNQYVSSNCECELSSLLSSELVNLEYSFSISSILVFKIVNSLIVLFWELWSFVIISASLVLLELLYLLEFNLLVLLFKSLFVLVIVFVQWNYSWPFLKNMKHCIFFQYCVYMRESF